MTLSQQPNNTVGPDALVDTGRAQARIDAQKDNPYRVLEGSFHAPKQHSAGAWEREFIKLVNIFIGAMGREGWQLVSPIKRFGPYPARDLVCGVVLLDMDEWRVRGVFKHTQSVQTVRVELPPDIVKRAPDHVAPTSDPAALKSALRANEQLHKFLTKETHG